MGLSDPAAATSPESAQVLALLAAFQTRFRTSVVPKRSSPLMRVVAWFLDLAGVLDSATFLDRFTTVVGRRIYAPFTPGEASGGYGLAGQLSVLVHEHQHVVQLERDGAVRFSLRYLLSRSARAAYEAEAYTCDLEVHHWRTGALRNARELAERLRSYDLRDVHIDAAHATLAANAARIAAGETVTEAGAFALEVLGPSRA